MIRAIKVESCNSCPSSIWKKCELIDDESKGPIPSFCPLPPWPSVSQEDIDYFCEEMETLLTNPAGKGSIQRNQEEGYLKWLFEKINVEIVEEKDESNKN